jgi:hypothetical protein
LAATPKSESLREEISTVGAISRPDEAVDIAKAIAKALPQAVQVHLMATRAKPLCRR